MKAATGVRRWRFFMGFNSRNEQSSRMKRHSRDYGQGSTMGDELLLIATIIDRCRVSAFIDQ